MASSRRAVWILTLTAILAYAVTWLGGSRLDYIYYLDQWQLVLDGGNPWSTNNAYGPLHNVFAYLVPLHPLVPKIVVAALLIIANGVLVLRLVRERPIAEWENAYILAFGGNFLVLASSFWLGLNDAFVAALIIAAILARRDGRIVLCGILLGLATLDKYYPALLVPFFALDNREVQPRLILGALLTIAIGLVAASIAWHTQWLEAVTFGISRDATILSVLRPIALLGRNWGIGPVVDTLIHYNGPLVVLVWIVCLIAAWLRRDNWLVAACWGFFAVLLTYKVGNQQFWLSWLALVAGLPLLNRPDADRLAQAGLPYATFLSLFQLGYVVIPPFYYRDSFAWVRDYVGVPSFILGIMLLWSFLRPESRPAP